MCGLGIEEFLGYPIERSLHCSLQNGCEGNLQKSADETLSIKQECQMACKRCKCKQTFVVIAGASGMF